MYLDQLVIYLTWPAFIIISWIIIKSALILYERKYPFRDAERSHSSEKEPRQGKE